jgi:hypothetical protein
MSVDADFLGSWQRDAQYFCQETQPRFGNRSEVVQGNSGKSNQAERGRSGKSGSEGPIPPTYTFQKVSIRIVGQSVQCPFVSRFRMTVEPDGKCLLQSRFSQQGRSCLHLNLCKGREIDSEGTIISERDHRNIL